MLYLLVVIILLHLSYLYINMIKEQLEVRLDLYPPDELIGKPKEFYLQSMVTLLNRRGKELPPLLQDIFNEKDAQKKIEKIMAYINRVLKKINVPLLERFKELNDEYEDELFFPLHFQACGSLVTFEDIELIRVCSSCSVFFLINKLRKLKNLCDCCRKTKRIKSVNAANRKHQGGTFQKAKILEEEFYGMMGFYDPEFDPDYKEDFVTYSRFKEWFSLDDLAGKKQFRKRYLERYLRSKFKDDRSRQKMRRLLKYQLKWDI